MREARRSVASADYAGPWGHPATIDCVAMPPAPRELLDELRRGLESIYGPRLKGLWLFGSYARGEQDDESDVDVLVVLSDIANYGTEVERTSGLSSALCLAHGPSVSLVFAREADWARPESPFLRNVRTEAIAA